MANTYTVDKHPQKKEIIKAMLNGVSDNKIATNYALSPKVVTRYKNGKLMKMLAEIWKEQQSEAGKELVDRYEEIATMLRKQLVACEEWLQDPTDPQKYTVAPRDNEVYVVTQWQKDGKICRDKELLSDVVKEIREHGKNVLKVQFNSTDTRKIILETAKVLQTDLDYIARLQGAVSDIIQAQNNPTIILSQIGSVVLNNLTLNEDKEAIVAELRKLQTEGQ